MQIILSTLRKLVAFAFIAIATYGVWEFFIIPNGGLQALIASSRDTNQAATSEEVVDTVDSVDAKVKSEGKQEVAQTTTAPCSNSVVITGLARSSCTLGKLHNSLVNKILLKQDFTGELVALKQMADLPEGITKWIDMLEQYQKLSPKSDEIFTLEDGFWGWLFAKTIKITKVNDDTRHMQELYQEIIQQIPVFNDFVFQSIYPKGCNNVYS